MTSRKRIVVIDDHPLYRENLKSIIATDAEYEITAEAGSGIMGLQSIRKFKPDLALVDVSLPDQNGIALTREILTCSPGTRVLIVSMHSKIDVIIQAFRTGARGYIVKKSAADMLLKGMDQVLKGNYFMDPSVSRQVVKKLAKMPAAEKSTTGDAYESLSPREQEILVLLAEGLSMRHIADKLSISPGTAEAYRSRILRKLGIRGITELTRYAAKRGLIDIDPWNE